MYDSETNGLTCSLGAEETRISMLGGEASHVFSIEIVELASLGILKQHVCGNGLSVVAAAVRFECTDIEAP